MLPEKSKQTQLVARVARRIIAANMDIDEIKTIKWTVRVVVSNRTIPQPLLILIFHRFESQGHRY